MAAPVYLIFGEDEYLVSSKARRIVDDLVPPDQRALGLEVIDGGVDTVAEASERAEQVLSALQTVGFFNQRKVVWLRDCSFLAETVTGKSEPVKSRVDRLAGLVKSGLDATQVLVVSAGKLSKKYAFYKACKAAGEIHEFPVSTRAYENEQRARMVAADLLKREGLKTAGPVRDMFLARVGTETRQIVNEVEKLKLYMGDRVQVEMDDIRQVTSLSRDALGWDLTDAVGERKLPEALKILRRLLFQKQSPMALIGALEGRVRDLTVYRDALDQGWLKVREAGRGVRAEWGPVPAEVEQAFTQVFKRDPRATHPYRIGVLAAQARNYTRRELAAFERALVETHAKLVSSSTPQDVMLEMLMVRTVPRARSER